MEGIARRNQRLKKRPTIRDVAARAGVSLTTVSHALNGKGRVDSQTIDTIRAAAAALGYQASFAARNLRKNRTGTIAILHSRSDEHRVSVIDLAHFISLVAGASQVAAAKGYHLSLMLPAMSGGLESLQVDGVIVIDPRQGDPLLRELVKRNIPFVSTGRDIKQPKNALWVDNDNRNAMLLVLQHLEHRGARKIALLTTPADYSYSLETIEAYEKWCGEHGQDPLVRELSGGINETVAYNATIDLLRDAEPPDAIHCVTDRYAMGALMALQSRNIDVPRDCMVSAGTDSDALRLSKPSVTALNLNPIDMGAKATEMLIASIEGRQVTGNAIIPIDLSARETTMR